MLKNKRLFFIFSILLPILSLSPLVALAYTLEMALPGAPTTISDPGQYIKYLFSFGFYLIAFLAVAMITYGGILYMIPSKMAEAKERIWGAVIGVVFLLCSFLILQTIDPNLLNLTPKTPAEVNTLKAMELPQIMANEMDFDTKGMTPEQMQQTLKDGKISGQGGSASCSIGSCGAQTVQGHQLASGAAAKYSNVQTSIKEACAAQGLKCDTSITSTVDGQHASSCHKLNNAKSGTCGDFVITAPECGGSIKLCPPAIKEKYIQIASASLGSSNNISSCLNEYKVKGSSFTTGGHFHCNF